MIKDIKKTIKFSQKEVSDIERACKRKGITFSHLVRIAVKKYLVEVLEVE